MSIGKAILAQLRPGHASEIDIEAFAKCLKRLERAQPKQARFRQLFRNRQSPLAA